MFLGIEEGSSRGLLTTQIQVSNVEVVKIPFLNESLYHFFKFRIQLQDVSEKTEKCASTAFGVFLWPQRVEVIFVIMTSFQGFPQIRQVTFLLLFLSWHFFDLSNLQNLSSKVLVKAWPQSFHLPNFNLQLLTTLIPKAARPSISTLILTPSLFWTFKTRTLELKCPRLVLQNLKASHQTDKSMFLNLQDLQWRKENWVLMISSTRPKQLDRTKVYLFLMSWIEWEWESIR